MDDLTKALKQQAETLQEFLAHDALEIIETEGLHHIEEAFDKQGFTDTSFKKWKPRKTTNTKGRDITRYKTDRVGKQGQLNRYGQKNKGRAVLTGHNTGGNKLRYSYRGEKTNHGVRFHTDKPYAELHNEGGKVMPKRQHIGESEALNKRIYTKIEQQLNKIFK